MTGIFVSYRRDDSQGFAGRLTDDLSDMLGPDAVFRDIEIPFGSDFTDILHRAIAASDILLVVIGRHWAADSDQGYESRLFEPADWVRIEIEAAFAQGKQVVPVLVGGAGMPEINSLPESIRKVSRLQAAALTDRHWDAQITELVERLRTMCPFLAQDREPTEGTGETPAEVLRELGGRLLDKVVSREKRRSLPPSHSTSYILRTANKLGRGLSKLLTLAVTLTLFYSAIRLFGDEAMLHHLDALESRLQIGWERFLHYTGQL